MVHVWGKTLDMFSEHLRLLTDDDAAQELGGQDDRFNNWKVDYDETARSRRASEMTDHDVQKSEQHNPWPSRGSRISFDAEALERDPGARVDMLYGVKAMGYPCTCAAQEGEH